MKSKLLTKKSGLIWCLFKVYTGVLFLLCYCATQSFYEVWVSKQKSSLFRHHGNCSLCYKMSRKSVFEETLFLAIQRLYIKDGNCQDFSLKKCSSSTNMVERPASVILFSCSFWQFRLSAREIDTRSAMPPHFYQHYYSRCSCRCINKLCLLL